MKNENNKDLNETLHRLQKEKIEIEIRKLKEPWYFKHQYITIILGFGSLILAFATGLFEDKIKVNRILEKELTTKELKLDSIQSQIENQQLYRDSIVSQNGEYKEIVDDLNKAMLIMDSLSKYSNRLIDELIHKTTYSTPELKENLKGLQKWTIENKKNHSKN